MSKLYLRKSFWPDLINYRIIIGMSSVFIYYQTHISLPNNNNYDLAISPGQIPTTNIGN